MKLSLRNQQGFSVIEVILAAALFVILASGAVAAILQGLQSNRLGEEQSVANQFASEGIEAVRSIKNQSFANLINSGGTGIAQNSGVWAFSGSTNTLSSKYTRVVTISDVQRDGSGNIVASGGTLDPATKKSDISSFLERYPYEIKLCCVNHVFNRLEKGNFWKLGDSIT
jgi:prepilin-type N-terminal cleavage/methylation domain-containing protein